MKFAFLLLLGEWEQIVRRWDSLTTLISEMTIEKVDMDMVERGVTRLQAIVRGRQARAKFAKLRTNAAGCLWID